jgi:ER lumen protein retaining receptor
VSTFFTSWKFASGTSLSLPFTIIFHSTTTQICCATHRPTNDPSIDTFRVEYLVGPAFLLGLLFNYSYSITEIFWSFSIFLEAVAILPQLFILQRTGEAETITTHYLAALGAYRGLYIPNWIYRCVILSFGLPNALSALSWHAVRASVVDGRYFAEGLVDPISITAGLVQTGLYLDFFYVYFTKFVGSLYTYLILPRVLPPRLHAFVRRVLQGQKFELPAWHHAPKAIEIFIPVSAGLLPCAARKGRLRMPPC